jgi:SAM-dependent methyltransferase
VQEETSERSPHRLVVEAANSLLPGRALDLACGTGRNALWLAQRHWNVTAVDGSPKALEILRRRATMELTAWDEQYRKQSGSGAKHESGPNPLVLEAARDLLPGRALDLACGTGRNALWLARRGWSVTAVDGSATAVEILRTRAERLGVSIDAQVADLEKNGFTIAPACYDLILMCYYLQRNLFEPCKRGLVPGGVMIAIALLMEPGKELSTFRLQPGELRGYFKGWDILHDREGADTWEHRVAEMVVRRPQSL